MSLPIIGITGYADRSARPPNVPIFALARTYVRAVTLGGGAPLVIPPYLEKNVLHAIFERLDGLLLSGGGDIYPSSYDEEDSGLLWRVDEQRDRAELAFARWAVAKELPLLGICRGIQALNVAAGGTLIQDVSTQVADALSHSCVAGRPIPDIAHTVEVTPDSRLATLIGSGEIGVNSAHHQAVRDMGSGLVATAWATDGVIEALEHRALPFCVGVQWHPEVMVERDTAMCGLFEGLVEAALAQS